MILGRTSRSAADCHVIDLSGPERAVADTCKPPSEKCVAPASGFRIQGRNKPGLVG